MLEVIQPALSAFKPDLIAVASGFDSSVFDPLGRMLLTAEGYREMTEILMESANSLCQGRLMATHEGGYNATYSPFCGLFVLQQLSGVRKLDDPFDHADRYPGHELKAHEKSIIDQAALMVREIGR
jgi:acetoin utilization deacetylase AcuC-like enzyme